MTSIVNPQLRLRQRAYHLLLSTLALAIIPPVMAQTPLTAFEVSSIRRAPPDTDPMTGHWSLPGIGRFNATHVSLARLIQLAYSIDDSQIVNKPRWSLGRACRTCCSNASIFRPTWRRAPAAGMLSSSPKAART